MEIFGPLLISTIAGLSTVVGGLIIFFKIKKINEFITFCLSMSLSVMIGISVLELIPESTFYIMNTYNSFGIFICISSFVMGNILVNFVNKKINNYKSRGKEKNNLYKLGILSALALMMHNLPEGIATFMASYKDITLGIHLGISIMLHNIPEGISIAVPLFYSTGKKGKSILYTFISGLAEPIGALLTYLIFKNYISDISISIILIFVAGIMITLAINEILPEALKYKKNDYLLSGLVVGVLLVIITHFVL